MDAQPQDTFEVQTGPRVTPSPSPNSANARNRGKFYELAELFAEIQSSFIINTFFKKHFEAMWAAMENTHGTSFWVSKDNSDPSTYKYSVPHIFAAACHNMQIVQAENKTIRFASANGEIKAKGGTFQFIPDADGPEAGTLSGAARSTKNMTLEDAFNVLMLASFNDHAPRKLELEGGNEEDRAIYYQAIKAFNESVPSGIRFRLDEDLAILVQNAPSAHQELAAYMNRVKLDKSPPGVNYGNTPKNPTIVSDREASQSALAEETASSENALHTKTLQSELSLNKGGAPANITTLFKDTALKQIRAHLEPDSPGSKWEDKDVAKYWSYLSKEVKSDIYSEIVSALNENVDKTPQAEHSRTITHNNGGAPTPNGMG